MDRRAFIGSSDIAAVMGMSRYKTPLALWAEKTGQLPEQDLSNNEAVEWGIRLEEVVAQKFAEKNGVKLMAYKNRFRHDDYPYMTCELDRIIVGTDEIVECKTSDKWRAREWEGEEMPQEYILQVMYALGISKRKTGHIAVLIGGNRYVEKRIGFGQEMFDKQVESAKHFMEYHIKENIAPVAVGGDAATLLALHPSGTEMLKAETEDLDKHIDYLQELKAQSISIEDEKDKIEVLLKDRIKDALGVETTKYKVVWNPQKTTKLDYNRLREDGIYNQYAVKGATRVLRINKKEG